MKHEAPEIESRREKNKEKNKLRTSGRIKKKKEKGKKQKTTTSSPPKKKKTNCIAKKKKEHKKIWRETRSRPRTHLGTRQRVPPRALRRYRGLARSYFLQQVVARHTFWYHASYLTFSGTWVTALHFPSFLSPFLTVFGTLWYFHGRCNADTF